MRPLRASFHCNVRMSFQGMSSGCDRKIITQADRSSFGDDSRYLACPRDHFRKCHFGNVNCSFESTSIVIVDVEIFHVRPILARCCGSRAPSPPAKIISEDAVSDCVCILLLSRKPVVVSSSRLFAPGRTGVTPRVVSCVRNRAFPVMPCAPDALSKLTSDISVFRSSRFDAISIYYSQPVVGFYICTLGPSYVVVDPCGRRVATSMRVAPKKASRTIYSPLYVINIHFSFYHCTINGEPDAILFI